MMARLKWRAILRIKFFQNWNLGSQSDLCPLKALNRAVAITSSFQSGTSFNTNSRTEVELIFLEFQGKISLNLRKFGSLSNLDRLFLKKKIVDGLNLNVMNSHAMTEGSRFWTGSLLNPAQRSEPKRNRRRFVALHLQGCTLGDTFHRPKRHCFVSYRKNKNRCCIN